MASYAPIYREERVMQNVLLAAIGPVLVVLGVNALCAIWLAPLLRHRTSTQHVWKIFQKLCWFSAAALITGSADTYFNTPEAVGIGLAIIAYGVLLKFDNTPLPLALVGATISIPTYFVSEVIVTGDIEWANLLTLYTLMAMLFFAMVGVGCRLYYKSRAKC